MKSRPTVKAERLLLSMKQRRHRAAILRAAGQWISAKFTAANGPEAELFIEEADGTVEPADIDVVVELVAIFEQRAESERSALVRLLAKNLESITENECPLVEGSEAAEVGVAQAASRGRRRKKKEKVHHEVQEDRSRRGA